MKSEKNAAQHAWNVVNPAFRGGTGSLAKNSNDAVRFAHHILLATKNASSFLSSQRHG
jgi:hypothetical protein